MKGIFIATVFMDFTARTHEFYKNTRTPFSSAWVAFEDAIFTPMKNVFGLRAFCIWLLAMQLATPNANTQPQTQSAKSPSDGPILDASKILPNNKDGIVVPSCQYMPEAPYTKEARKAKYQGIFVAEAIIELDGKLSNVRVVKSPGLGLDKPVLETLKKWKCTPAIGPSGKPVRTRIPIEISFRLGS